MAPEVRGEGSEYLDPVSGVRVFQMTSYLGHSNHAYFTHPEWLDGGRSGYSQLYLADVPDDITTLPGAGDGLFP